MTQPELTFDKVVVDSPALRHVSREGETPPSANLIETIRCIAQIAAEARAKYYRDLDERLARENPIIREMNELHVFVDSIFNSASFRGLALERRLPSAREVRELAQINREVRNWRRRTATYLATHNDAPYDPMMPCPRGVGEGAWRRWFGPTDTKEEE